MLQDPIYKQIVHEYFDIHDKETRQILLALDEADAGNTLNSLTGKLYEIIVDKVDDVDFGLIPQSKGDITKVDGIDKLIECLELISDIIIECKQDISPVQSIIDCIKNIQSRTSLFEKAYTLNLEIPILLYNTMVLSVFDATTYMITNVIDFIKDPNTESFQAVVNSNNLKKTKNALVMKNIGAFNVACKYGNVDKTIEYSISAKAKGFAIGATSLTAVGVFIVAIIPIIRELIYLYYHARVTMNDYLSIQADLIQMNIAGLEMNDSIDPEKKARIIKKQANIVANMRKLANVIEVKEKKAENKTISTINSENRTYRFNEISDELPDSAATNSLF